ncbi:hypothetical protein H257_08890 [Aphanomyces astaci]|uniref:Uncharacterized protein n=1 Tax=Aphanomyces astaci TaxID=112090 RepID=W4GEI1_APHAT|nr:hypothetical protein H257_08890 [Aphanomyces astaci]ETV77479.1 hypothetical protein H257_08890 [Aphanomyces astaci]|eukprot:XP_009833266.1 hypothetical protein H257_08890 [Aphanomyces astaci]
MTVQTPQVDYDDFTKGQKIHSPHLILANEDVVVAQLEEAGGEMAYAVKGYRDANFFVYPPGLLRNPQRHKVIMTRHETVNRRMK